MNCRKYKIMISKYLDKQLYTKDLPLLLEHIKICPECDKEFKIMLTIETNLPEYDQVSLFSNFDTKLIETITVKKDKKKFVFIPLIRRQVMLNYTFLIIFTAILGIVLNRTACKQQFFNEEKNFASEIYSSNDEYNTAFFDLLLALKTAEEDAG